MRLIEWCLGSFFGENSNLTTHRSFHWLHMSGKSCKFPVLELKVKLSVTGGNLGRRLRIHKGPRVLLLLRSTLTGSSCFLPSAFPSSISWPISFLAQLLQIINLLYGYCGGRGGNYLSVWFDEGLGLTIVLIESSNPAFLPSVFLVPPPQCYKPHSRLRFFRFLC